MHYREDENEKKKDREAGQKPVIELHSLKDSGDVFRCRSHTAEFHIVEVYEIGELVDLQKAD